MNRGNFSLEGGEDPCWNGYEARGMKQKNGKTVPNCVKIGTGFSDFSRDDLRDIILHKNKVIEDLEKHAYGSASWIDNLNKGLKKANEIKDKVDKKSPKESEADFRKRLEGFDKDKDAPTENWGADELNGGVLTQAKLDSAGDTIRFLFIHRDDLTAQVARFSLAQLTDLEEMIDYFLPLGHIGADTKAFYRQLKPIIQREIQAKTIEMAKEATGNGGAAPKVEPKPPSGVAAAAAALQPVRTAIQNGIGDAIYGKETDPKKQRKGLLGISEEGKEESQKKVMKNIVVPVMKWAKQAGTDIEDAANKIFNRDKYDADMKERRIKRIKKDEAQAGIVRDKENPMIIVRKPAGLWKADTTDPTEEAYYTKRIASRKPEDVFYIRVPNPIFAAKLRPSFQELGQAGFVKQVGNDRQIDLWTGVNQFEKNEDIDGTLKSLHDDEFIFIPENRAKDIYGKLRNFVQGKEEAKEVVGFENTGITKGFMKRIASIDPRTLKGQDLIDYKQSKLRIDDATADSALNKVDKDIKDEMAKATPDQTRLTKMREAKERVIKRQQELAIRGQKEYKEATVYLAPIAAEKERKRVEDFKREREEAQKEYQAEQAEFLALPVAERLAQLEELKRQMEEQTGEGSFTDYDEQIEQLRAEAASEKVENQAQGSVDLLQQAQVVGGGISSSKKNKVAPEPTPQPVSASMITFPSRNADAVVGQVVGCSEEDNAVILSALKLANQAGKDGVMMAGMATPIIGLRMEYEDEFRRVIRGTILYEFFYYQQRGRDLLFFMSDVAVGNIRGRPPLDDIVRDVAKEVCVWTINEIQRTRANKDAVFDMIKRNTERVRRMRGGSIPTNPALYEKAKAIVNKSYPKHSAYRSGAYVKKYKEMGGEYEDEPDGKRPLERWFKEDWKDVGNKEYPVYRPTKRISKDTPLTPDEIDPENLKLQVKEKQKIRGERNLSAFQKRGGEGGDDDDSESDEEERIEIIRIDMGKGRVYFVDAPLRDEKGELVGFPLGAYKVAISKPVGIGRRRVYDPETKEELGILRDPIFKKVAMKVLAMEKGWREENLNKFGFSRYDSESDDEEMEGAGAMEYILQKAGVGIFNPSGDRTMAGRQSFTPDYDAYGLTVADGRKNAFNLSRSMYDQSKAIELPDFKLVRDDTSLRFYRKDDEMVILVGVRGTDFQSWTDFYTWFVIGSRSDLRMTTRFQDDLAKLIAFQRQYPPSQFYYVATGHSLAGSIIDRFLEMGLVEEAITYNPSIEKRHLLEEGILNHRVYLDTDPLFMLMGQYSPNTEIRVNPNKTNFYNPSKEKDYLIASHLISPVYNSAFEGGGMEGSGKTYTLEEWKAIFDAKLEQKRKAIEAREAKKKQTAKAKRERAKAVRDGRDKPKEPEPEAELEVTQFTIEGQIILVEDDDAGEKRFLDRRVFNDDSEEIGTLGSLTPEKLRKLVVERVQRAEKQGEFAPEVVFSEDEEDDDDDDDEPPPLEAPFRTSRVQKATPPKGEPKKRKPRFKIVAPASARVELREELVAEQPRTEQGKFAEEAETAVVAVSQAPQRAYMKLMKSPIFTDTERKMLMKIRETKMTPRMRAVLLGRSGLARKVMEMMGLDESAFQTQRARARIADTTEKRVATKKATENLFPHLPADIKRGLRKLAQDIMNMKGRRPTMLDDSRRTDTLQKMTLAEKREMLRRNFVAGVKSCEAIVNMTRTDMFGDYSCRKWEAGEPSYFKQVEKSDYGVKKKCMAIGDDAGIPQGATLDQLKPVVGVGRDGAMMSSRMLCELSPSTWGVEDKPEPKNVRFGVPLTKSTPDADLAEHIRETQKVWRMCILKMMKSCGIDAAISKELSGTWKRGYGVVIFWTALQGDSKLTKVKIREAQQEIDEKLSSPKLKEFLVDLRGFCEMTAEGAEAEDEGEVAQRTKDAEEKAYLRRVASEMNPDEEEERARISANPELRSRLRSAIQRNEGVMRRHGMMNATYSTSVQSLNHFKRLAGIDYNAGYGAVAPFNLSASQKAKLPERKKKDYQSVEEYISTPDDRDTGVNR